MRVAFAGTPEFAAASLHALLASRHHVVLVLTQPDRPAGRGMELRPSAVKRLALEHHVPVNQPPRLKDPATHESLRDASVEVLVVAAYGLILPQAVLDIPRRGAINVHASLLPRWRGAAPIHRAILAGDPETGISIMQMEAGLDTGPVLLTGTVPIAATDTTGSLHDTLAQLGGRLIVETLDAIEAGHAPVPRPQDGDRATYAAKIDKQEARIDWSRDAAQIHRQVRAFNPSPGASTRINGAEVKVWQARPAPAANAPAGSVLEASGEGIAVACGAGAGSLVLEELQKAGGRRLAAREFLLGFPVAPGQRFE
jgi:methionyl-tRNA formyltransferase